MHSPYGSCRVLMTRAAVGAAVLLGAASTASAQPNALEGVWGVVTQERICATNAPIGPPTRALVTYHAGGTVTESRYIPVFAPGQLSEGHGVWSHAGGATFTGRVVTMIQFDSAANTPPGSPGFQAGWQIAMQTITLTGADSFTMTGTSQFYNGNRDIYRTGCASRVGERFK
ncbi:MAG: hypothetical protein ACT4QD_21520 [Acidobacteriota bacterium]